MSYELKTYYQAANVFFFWLIIQWLGEGGFELWTSPKKIPSSTNWTT